jgi:peptidoglycan/LPS O-acetylase OafA/YrhL
MTLKRPYFANLDGIRAVACLMVFVAHIWDYLNNRESLSTAENWIYTNFIADLGTTGVCLFFVLSGFLITTLLLREKDVTGTISLKNFYARRVLRIWPMFFLVILLGFFIVPLISGNYNASETGKHIPWYILFANNFDRIATGFRGFGNDTLGVLWSVAVEEQFYLLWPLLVLFISKKWFPVVPILIIIFSIVFRYYHSSDNKVLSFHTFSVMSDLAIGSLVAWLVTYRTLTITNTFRISIYLLIFGLLLFHQSLLSNAQYSFFGRTILALGFCFIILDQVINTTGVFRFSSAKWLSKFGIITYGFYCLHLFVVMGIQKLNIVLGLKTISTTIFMAELFGVFLITVGASILSYRYFEQPLLRLKHHFESLPKVTKN